MANCNGNFRVVPRFMSRRRSRKSWLVERIVRSRDSTFSWLYNSLSISLTVDELKRVYCTIGAFLLITSILFSPALQHLLSNRHLVFLGSISFSMYLLHATMMRTVLAWIVFGLLPSPTIFPNVAVDELDSVVVRVVELNTPSTVMGAKGIVFALWMMLLIFISTIWRDRVDGFSIEFARSVEDIMSGRRSICMPRIGRLLSRNMGDKGIIDEVKEVSIAIA